MLIDISKYTKINSNIRFVHKSVLIGNDENSEYRVVLLLENQITKIKVPHPLTSFLSEYNRLEHSSVIKKANVIVPFLNYVYFVNSQIYKLKSLYDLKFEHAEDFLNDLSSGSMSKKVPKRKTVEEVERILKEFFLFLVDKNLLINININQFVNAEFKNENLESIKYFKSPFKNVKYPRKINSNLLKSIPFDLILPFIDLAITETPDIALGIYFQMFGGLRISEVINISIFSIELIGSNGQYGMIIDLKRRYFRKDLSNNNGKGGVKKPRKQLIIPAQNILSDLYKKHLKKYHQLNDQEALFLNNQGNPMTEKSYRSRFDRLKECFVKCLENHRNPYLNSYSLVLRSKKWSTHIGRGTFSKLIADYSKNPTELAILRGDSTYESALTYIQGSFGVKEAIQKVMDNFYGDLINLK